MKQNRVAALRARRGLGADKRAGVSELVCKRGIYSRLFFASKAIACYLPMDGEGDTRGII